MTLKFLISIISTLCLLASQCLAYSGDGTFTSSIDDVSSHIKAPSLSEQVMAAKTDAETKEAYRDLINIGQNSQNPLTKEYLRNFLSQRGISADSLLKEAVESGEVSLSDIEQIKANGGIQVASEGNELAKAAAVGLLVLFLLGMMHY